MSGVFGVPASSELKLDALPAACSRLAESSNPRRAGWRTGEKMWREEQKQFPTVIRNLPLLPRLPRSVNP